MSIDWATIQAEAKAKSAAERAARTPYATKKYFEVWPLINFCRPWAANTELRHWNEEHFDQHIEELGRAWTHWRNRPTVGSGEIWFAERGMLLDTFYQMGLGYNGENFEHWLDALELPTVDLRAEAMAGTHEECWARVLACPPCSEE